MSVEKQRNFFMPKKNIKNIQHVKKRDGRIVGFYQSKITEAILKALQAGGKDNKNLAKKISDSVVRILNRRFKEEVPKVEEIQDITIEALAKEGQKDISELYSLYRQKRKELRDTKWWLLSRNVKTRLTPNALRVLESRYLKKDENGKIIETPQQLFQRVAANVASAESFFNPSISDNELFDTGEKFYRMMASLEFLPNSPTLMNAGGILQQLSACFVLPVGDSMEEIFEAIKNTALIHQSGGGTGFNFSRLRPKGDLVKSTQGQSSGPLSFMAVFNAATEVVKQGGKRRGANMGILRVDHPDILEFITSKEQEGNLSNFNISVALTDKFMQAVKRKKEYDLINPHYGEISGQLDANKVFDLIVHYAWKNGEPGIIFIDRINKDNPTPKLGEIESTNPCGEQPLLPFESCNLGSINLNKMIKKKTKRSKILEFDWDKLEQTTHNAVHFLDNVIEVNRYPLPEIERLTKGNRKIGLGAMGLADMLIKLRIPYNSRKALTLGKNIMKLIQEQGRKASSKLAEQRGVFPNFKDSIYNKKGMPKVRNATVTTIAPTGTIGVIAGTSSAIEPIFAIAFTRKYVLGNQELIEVNSIFEEIAKERGFWSKKLIKEVVSKGNIKDIKDIPADVKKIFITALDIKPEDHIRMQAAFQKYVDNATSKTINFPYSASEDDIKKAYIMSYELGCKGITLYRNESRKQQVLNIKSKRKKKLSNDKQEKIPEKNITPELKDPSPDIPDLPSGDCPNCNV